MYKEILALAPEAADVGPTLGQALVAARAFNARVTLLHPESDPRQVLSLVADGIGGITVQQVLASAETAAAERRAAVTAAFEAARLAEGLEDGADRRAQLGVALASAIDDADGTAVLTQARLSDLVVARRPAADGPMLVSGGGFDLVSLLLEAGRPVLLAPPGPPRAMATVAIAWNGAREAAVAVAAAMPLIRRAAKVVPLVGGDASPLGLEAHLADHGAACVESARIEAGSLDAGPAVHAAALAAGADLLVMGAYGHSRLRELLLGGASQWIARHAEIPVLLAH